MTRINKWLSEMGVCSRKQADRLIADGLVTVNQKVAFLGMCVAPEDTVRVNGETISIKPEPVIILYHKPVGVVCTHDLNVTDNIESALNYPQRIFAVGRLDKASEGLLLMTNQGDIVNRIMRAENHHKKVYRVWVNKVLTQDFLLKMASGVPILKTTTLPCKVKVVEEFSDENVFEITLTQGLNLQIRRMCKALGYKVCRLQRTQIMQFGLEGLMPGEYRKLSAKEIGLLQESIANSSNEN